MESVINSRFVKLSGRIPFPKDINLGDDVTINVGGHNFIANCVKQETFDLQDGTVDIVFVLKSTNE